MKTVSFSCYIHKSLDRFKLAHLQTDYNSVSYKYNSNGTRTSKTINRKNLPVWQPIVNTTVGAISLINI